VLNVAGGRLAKRDGAVTLSALRELGVSTDEVVAWIAQSLDLAVPEEVVALDRLIERFDPEHIPLEPVTAPELGVSTG
jgi:glutamyl-tRNA synthetase